MRFQSRQFVLYEPNTHVHSYVVIQCDRVTRTLYQTLTLSNPIFLPTAYSPALICFGRERGWWITCNYPTVLKEDNIEKQKEYNLRYLLAKVRTTWGKASDRIRQRAKKRNKNRVGRLPTSERNKKFILSDEVRRSIGKGSHFTTKVIALTFPVAQMYAFLISVGVSDLHDNTCDILTWICLTRKYYI
jgi:hypothetical protein